MFGESGAGPVEVAVQRRGHSEVAPFDAPVAVVAQALGQWQPKVVGDPVPAWDERDLPQLLPLPAPRPPNIVLGCTPWAIRTWGEVSTGDELSLTPGRTGW